MNRLRELDTNDCIFIDIETSAIVPELKKDTPLYDSWVYKMKYSKDKVEKGENSYEQMFLDQAALYPEFAKVLCVTIGKIKDGVLKIKSFCNDDEKVLLTEFNNSLNALLANNKNTKLVGHYILGFDIPFLLKRSIVCGVEPNKLIDINHLKPWNCDKFIIDTHTLWQGGSRQGASLMNIAIALGLNSPKDEMYGYQTTEVYWKTKDGLQRIQKYCEDDVLTTANIFRKCRFEDIVAIERNSTPVTENTKGVMEQVFNSKTITTKQRIQLKNNFDTLKESEHNIAKELINIVTA